MLKTLTTQPYVPEVPADGDVLNFEWAGWETSPPEQDCPCIVCEEPTMGRHLVTMILRKNCVGPTECETPACNGCIVSREQIARWIEDQYPYQDNAMMTAGQ